MANRSDRVEEKSPQREAPTAEPSKRAWTRPRLTTFGDFRAVTANNGGPGADTIGASAP
jgi:hypothetical protein